MASLCEDLLAGREKVFERPDGFGGTAYGASADVPLTEAGLPIAADMTSLTAGRSFDRSIEFGDFISANYQYILAKDTNINLVFTTATMQTANENSV